MAAGVNVRSTMTTSFIGRRPASTQRLDNCASQPDTVNSRCSISVGRLLPHTTLSGLDALIARLCVIACRFVASRMTRLLRTSTHRHSTYLFISVLLVLLVFVALAVYYAVLRGCQTDQKLVQVDSLSGSRFHKMPGCPEQRRNTTEGAYSAPPEPLIYYGTRPLHAS